MHHYSAILKKEISNLFAKYICLQRRNLYPSISLTNELYLKYLFTLINFRNGYDILTLLHFMTITKLIKISYLIMYFKYTNNRLHF